MFFIELDEGQASLADIQRISQHITEHRQLVSLMTTNQAEDLSTILAPTLRADHDEDNKREHWQRLLKEFVIHDAKGEPIRFYREPRTGRLYFANQQGIDAVIQQTDAELDSTASR